MATIATRRPRVKAARSVRLLRPAADGVGHCLLITVGGVHHAYEAHPVPSDFGTAFRLLKWESVPLDPGVWELQVTARYNVCLDPEGDRCDCLGHARHGHCKHASGLRKLRELGLI
jgi:hypothetical protein